MLKVAVIGGGASGLMAAITVASYGANTVIYEKNERMARKVMITGKGRCNVTNSADKETLQKAVVRNPKFMYSAFSEFDCADTVAFFENENVALKTERGGRIFPVSDKAVTIVDALVNKAKRSGVKFIHKEVFCISDDLVINNTDKYDRVIIATGGASYTATGSTGDGYKFAKSLKHTVTEILPSLVPIESDDEWCSSISGLSLKNVTLSVYSNSKNKMVFKEMGEMLFCHFGVSGPLVLSASAHLDFTNDGYYALIDLKPALSEDVLDKRLVRELSEAKTKEIQNIIGKIAPVNLGKVLLYLSEIPLNTKCCDVTREMRKALLNTIKNLRVNLTGFRPINEAIITRGGVSVKEINPKTMESKIVKGLYFAGEVIDVDAYTGGFNLQIAFSTGFVAGKNAGNKGEE